MALQGHIHLLLVRFNSFAGIWHLGSWQMQSTVPAIINAGFYCAANIVLAACIVFANKWVFSVYNFKFVFALTWVHTVRCGCLRRCKVWSSCQGPDMQHVCRPFAPRSSPGWA